MPFLLFPSRRKNMSGIDGISDSLLDSNLHRCFKMAALKLVIETEKNNNLGERKCFHDLYLEFFSSLSISCFWQKITPTMVL